MGQTGKEPVVTHPPADATVIAASLDDPAEFAAIFDRHFDPIYRFFERRVGRDTADSLAGEVFRIAFERRNSYRADGRECLPWLYGIAGNLVMKERRREIRHLRALARLGARPEPTPSDHGVEERLDARAIWPSVASALEALPDGERDVLLLVAWEDLTYPQVAEALGLPVGTVRSRLHRGRQRLRELLEDRGKEVSDNHPQLGGRSQP